MSNREILYIEDNFHNRRIVRKILERQGYTLHEREDGLEGYEFLKELKPGVVLLDISLPTMDGMEIARRVKEDPEVQHIYLIALTASAMQGDRERFLDAGCDDYLSKPFRALDLVDLVNKYAELVAANVPAPPPQPSEMHETGQLEIEKNETAPEPVKIEAAEEPEPTIEASTELALEALQVPEIVEAAAVEAKPEVEETATAMPEPAAEEDETTSVYADEAAPMADEVEEPVAAAVEPVVEKIEPTRAVVEEVESITTEPKDVAAAVSEPLEAEIEPPNAFVEETALIADEVEEIEPEPELIESVAEEVEAVDEARIEVEVLETEPVVQPDASTVIEPVVEQVESEPVDLPDMADQLDFENPPAEIEAKRAPLPASEVEDLTKKNGSRGTREVKNTEEIDAIKAGIMGVINPKNLKPVDPNNHRE